MAQVTFFRGAEFDDFLFATVWEEENGMMLSVQSAIARANLDPWQEASALSQLPRGVAASRLAKLIAALPTPDLARHDSRSIAERLIELLPRRDTAFRSTRTTNSGQSLARRFSMIFWIIAVLAVAVLVAQWVAPDRTQRGADQPRPATPSTPIPDRVDG